MSIHYRLGHHMMVVRTREDSELVKVLDLLIEAIEDFDRRLKALERSGL